MKRNIFKIFAVLMVLAMLVAPASAKEVQEDFVNSNPPSGTPTLLPQAIIDEFREGMSIEEFLIRNRGPIPNALMEYADLKVTVIVQMEQPSLIEYMGQVKSSTANMSASTQKSYVQSLQATQGLTISAVEKLGGQVMGQYTKTINGFMVRVSAKELNAIRSLPGVKEVRMAPEHVISLTHSVPLINADDVWNMPSGGFEGTGITVAVIDTGIDYTHAMFGGSGVPTDYSGNDPDVIEPGSFPTLKIIGGYDFAGTNYDAGSDDPLFYTPVEDPDPLDENGHGTHVASTIAGVDVGFGNGVAPDASLYSLKVFGKTGTTNLVLDAIEWAMDPNGDLNMSDHVDVLNISVDSVFGAYDANDPVLMALEAASAIGVFVVAPAGNGGNSSYIVGSPSISDSALSVAASSTGYQTVPIIVYNDGTEKNMPYNTSSNPFSVAITADFVDVDTIDGADNGDLCDITGIAALALDGKIALINRGDIPGESSCTYDIKIDNAETLGAVAVIIYNNTNGVFAINTAVSTLPAGSILQSDSGILKLLVDKNITVGPDTTVAPFPADSIAKFSARGPRGFDSKLKPEITAPGVSIVAAEMGGGNTGVPMSGTSMAAPHVAGVAALIKEAHPDWTNEQIKAAMMNTATDLVDTAGEIPRQGAGRVDAYAALNTDVVAVGDPKLVSLSWGLIEVTGATYQDIKTVTIYNFSGSAKTLDVTTAFTNSAVGATLIPSQSQVVIPPNNSISIDVTLNLDTTQLPLNFGTMEEYYGFVTFTEGANELRVPFYFVPRPYTEMVENESVTTFDIETGSGYVDLTQTGPQASKLNAYPVFLVDVNEGNVLDAGDLRYVGMDYWGNDPGEGDLVVAAFNMWGPVHTNQPYFNEINLLVDVDQEGTPDYKYFNSNFGNIQGDGDNNVWGILQVDLSDDYVKLGSPFLIEADFNSGFQAWYLPTAVSYLGIVGTTFDYEVKSFDWNRVEDQAGKARFDYAKKPFAWDLTNDTPGNTSFKLNFSVNDIVGFDYSNPEGIMLVDYFGKPGLGQVYYWPINPLYTPVALDQNLSTNEDVPLNIILTGNHLTPEPIVWTIESDPANGTLSGTAPDLVYTPDLDWHGTDSFTFSVNNGLASNIATIEIVVNPVNDAPITMEQAVSTSANTAVEITLEASDVDGDVLTYIINGPVHGTLTGSAPNLLYTPELNWSGEDSFTFKVNDGLVDSNVSTVTITVIQPVWKIFLPLLTK